MSATRPAVQAMADAVIATELSRRALERLGVPTRLIAAGALAATVDLVRTRALSIEAAAEGVARTLHAAEWQPEAYADRPIPPMVVFIAPPAPEVVPISEGADYLIQQFARAAGITPGQARDRVGTPVPPIARRR